MMGKRISGSLVILEPPGSVFKAVKLQLIHEWFAPKEKPTKGDVELLSLRYYPKSCVCVQGSVCPPGSTCDLTPAVPCPAGTRAGQTCGICKPTTWP